MRWKMVQFWLLDLNVLYPVYLDWQESFSHEMVQNGVLAELLAIHYDIIAVSK